MSLEERDQAGMTRLVFLLGVSSSTRILGGITSGKGQHGWMNTAKSCA